MVNFGLNAAAILGLLLAVAGAGLFFLRSVRPELARDYDIFFAAVGLLCGIILLFNGWRLDPILQFGQFLLTGTAVFFAFDSIRMRSVATEQARRNTPIVDRDRPVSRTRVYTEAELDKFDTYDNYEGKPNYNSPRLRGYDDPQPRPSRRSAERRRPSPTPDIRDEPRRDRSRNRPEPRDYTTRDSGADRYGYSDRADRDSRPPARPRPSSTAPTNGYDDWSAGDEWDDSPRSSARPRPRPRPTRENRDDPYSEPTPPTTSRSRPNPVDLGRSYDDSQDDYGSDTTSRNYDSDLGRDYNTDLGRSYEEKDESIPGDYVVDYQPLEDPETDYSDDYDDPIQDDYDDYDNSDDSNSGDDYDDYREQPERRKPINFNDYD